MSTPTRAFRYQCLCCVCGDQFELAHEHAENVCPKCFAVAKRSNTIAVAGQRSEEWHDGPDITSPNSQVNQRRRRVIYVPEQFVLALLSRGLVHDQFIRVPDPIGLPETARVVGVWTDWSRNAFALVVTDPSFSEVPEMTAIPELSVTWSIIQMAVTTQAQSSSGID